MTSHLASFSGRRNLLHPSKEAVIIASGELWTSFILTTQQDCFGFNHFDNDKDGVTLRRLVPDGSGLHAILPAPLTSAGNDADVPSESISQYPHFMDQPLFTSVADGLGAFFHRVGNLESQLHGVEEDKGNLETRLRGVEEDKGNLETRLRGVEEELHGVEEDKGHLENRLRRVDEEKGNLENRLRGVEEDKGRIENRLRNVEEELREEKERREDMSKRLEASMRQEREERNEQVEPPIRVLQSTS